MIKFKNDNLTQAATAFNIILKSRYIEILLIQKLNEFDRRHTNVSKLIIHDMVLLYKDSFNPVLKKYRPANPWSKAYATTYTGNYNLIEINSRRFNRPWQSLAGIIAHEWGHCLEYYVKKVESDPRCKNYFFNHGVGIKGNYPGGKENTFQYWLGTQIKLMLNSFDSYDEFVEKFNK